MTPYYDDGCVQIWHADVRELDPKQFAGRVACVVSSPPYNVDLEYDEWSDFIPWADYWDLALHAAHLVGRSLIDGGRCWWNTAVSVPSEPTKGPHCNGRTGKRRVPLAQGWSGILRQHGGLSYIDTIAWTSMRGSGTAWGSYEMPTAPNLRGDYEAIEVLCKGEWERKAPITWEGWKDTDGGWPDLCTTVWTMNPARRDEHPAPFPSSLAAAAIRLSTWPEETVLDPFMGTGTTLRAAKDLGRKAIGVELSEAYCEQAAIRLGQGVLL